MNRYARTAILLALCLTLAWLRFYQPGHDLSWSGTYEASAHLLVGGLIGAYMATRKQLYLWLCLGLTAVEVYAFVSKGGMGV